MGFEYETRDEQMSSPRKRAKLGNEKYQELNDFDEFDKLLQTLRIKENELENEERVVQCLQFCHKTQDLIENCISFLDKSYGFVAPVSKRFQESYRNVFDGNTETDADFRSLSKDAGVYLIESFPCNSFDAIDQKTVFNFIYGIDPRMRYYSKVPQKRYSVHDYLVHKAGRQGNLDVLRHFVANGYNILNAQDRNMILFQKVAENGHLHVLQYLKDEYNFFYGLCCSSYGAAKGGHIHILNWLRNQECLTNENEYFVKSFCGAAMKTGNLEVIKWMRNSNIGNLSDFKIWCALCSNSLEVVRYCHSLDSSMDHVTEHMIVSTGKIDIVKFFLENDFHLTNECIQTAALNEDIHIIKYLLEEGFDLELDHSELENYFELIKLQFEVLATWRRSSIKKCLRKEGYNFNVDMLRYLCDNDCPWGKIRTSELIKLKLKQIQLLECIIENKMNTRRALFQEVFQEKWMEGINYMLSKSEESDWPSLGFACSFFKNVEDLIYLRSKGMAWHSSDITYITATKNFDVLKLFVTQAGPEAIQNHDMMEIAYHFNYNLEVLQYLFEIGCPFKFRGIDTFNFKGGVEVLSFLHVHFGLDFNENIFTTTLHRFANFPNEEWREILHFLLKIKCPQESTIDRRLSPILRNYLL